MNIKALEKNIIDVIYEQQLKLGYRKEMVRLYYPLSSLNRFLETDYDVDAMSAKLEQAFSKLKQHLGEVNVSHSGERFCVAIPPEGTEYIHLHEADNTFLRSLIEMVSTHGTTIEQIIALFESYSDSIVVDKVDNGEFDYLIYFEDDTYGDYRYCFSLEMCHVIYHRYTKADYEDFGF